MPSRSAVSGFRNTTATKDPQINALSGLGLGTAFKRFVLEDARVRELGEQVVAPDGRHREVFEQGQSPGPVIEFTWHLMSTQPNSPTPSCAPLCFSSRALLCQKQPRRCTLSPI